MLNPKLLKNSESFVVTQIVTILFNLFSRKRHSYPDFYPHTDVTVEIVDPNTFQLFDVSNGYDLKSVKVC